MKWYVVFYDVAVRCIIPPMNRDISILLLFASLTFLLLYQLTPHDKLNGTDFTPEYTQKFSPSSADAMTKIVIPFVSSATDGNVEIKNTSQSPSLSLLNKLCSPDISRLYSSTSLSPDAIKNNLGWCRSTRSQHKVALIY
jgi:hypothetical protein